MCWSALHHAERLGRRLRLQADYAHWYACRRAIRAAICEHGWSDAKRSFVQVLGGELVYRYCCDDGLPGREGAFLACSFWLVEALTVLGRLDEAVELFEKLERRRNDVGLYAEELDADTGEARGNFPQAFSHMTHIRAALRLDAALAGHPATRAARPANA